MGQVRRRQFLISAGALLVVPLGARAQSLQSASTKTLGILDLYPATPEPPGRSSFLARLKELGWVEGQNLVIERAFAELKVERLPALAEGLARKRVDVIWATGAEAAVAAARASGTIPIVFWETMSPVEQGLIDSFARPGRNVTGVSLYTGIEVATKRMQFLREIAPAAKRLSWITAPDMLATVVGGQMDIMPALGSAARGLKYELRMHFVRESKDFDAVFAEILSWRAQAISVAIGPLTFAARQRIADFAIRNRLPSAFIAAPYVEAGGLLSYGSDMSSTAQRSAEYVDRILRGARPADLPVEQPSKYDLVVNLKTAKALGLTIPQSLLLRANRVIE